MSEQFGVVVMQYK